MQASAPTLNLRPPDDTIGGRLLSRQNNFDFIRLVAAFLVIVSHSWPIRDGSAELEPYRILSGYCTLGEISVGIFFVISGLLVARSFLSDPDPAGYLRKRALRIFPALIVCVAFCIFVVGPLFTELGFRDYLLNKETFRFARNAILYPNHYHLPGVFEDFDPRDRRYVVNGSLWTLPLEFLMYLGVLALGVTRLLDRKWIVALLTGLLLVQWVWAQRFFERGGELATHLAKYQVWIETVPMLGLLFFSGTLLLLFRDRIKLDGRIFLACLVVIAATWQTSQGRFVIPLPLFDDRPIRPWHAWHGYLPLCLCLPYIVAYLGFVRVPVLQSVTKWGDFSYGVYLYGYPVQQMLMRTWGEKLPFPVFIGLACVLTVGLAALSWHLVEKPFLKLKRRSTRVEPGEVLKKLVAPQRYAGVVA